MLVRKPDCDTRSQSPWESDGSKEQDAVVINGETDEMPHAIRSLIQRKAKAQLQPVMQPPIQETFMIRAYMYTELIDIAANFQKKKGQG